ncbi:MAG: glycosyl hydrolase family 28-related protein [Nostocaceae cyanobacterium]|nr:glycosyl hydrolase family 28-related protein [Nostocaceae cyanobacterium]
MKIAYILTIIAGVSFSACLGITSNPQQSISVPQQTDNPLIANALAVAKDKQKDNDNIVFPEDGGIINVKAAPYNAKGDGVTDDTAAIQAALSDYPNGNKIIYLPNGTYLVSKQLQWPDSSNGGWKHKRTILQGQNRSKTIVKLKDKATDFTNPARPKSVIWTGTRPAQRFRNAIRNLTVDTGKGNRGAIGIQYIANNQGSIRNVTIKSGDGQGLVGLDLRYTDEVGPCLIKNLQVIGFERGIYTGNKVNSQTFENIILQNQRQYGLYNGGQVISIRNLTSINTVPAVYNAAGLVTLLDANLVGTDKASNQAAITNKSTLFARNIKTYGYQMAIKNRNGTRKNATAAKITEFVSHPIQNLFSTPAKSLNLPIKDTPIVPWDALDKWVSPTKFGAIPDDRKDDSAAIQAAIDSGKTTVYFPNGTYNIDRTIYIRGNVKRIIGLEARIRGSGMFKFTDGSSPLVIMERLDGNGGGIIHASNRTLVLSSMGVANYSNTGSGELYIEDVASGPWTFNQQKVWARQLNVENPTTKITNNGGTLWILGLKTERGGIVVDTKSDGKTEVAGGFIYSTSGPKQTPMFTNQDSSVSLTVSECNFNRNYFTTLVMEKRDRQRKTLNRGDALRNRCNGSTIPLYRSYSNGELKPQN